MHSGQSLFLFFHWKRRRLGAGLDAHRDHAGPDRAFGLGLREGLATATLDGPELKGLIDDYVKDEIATREAVAMGLDQDDTIIRRRLRQKLEFLIEDAAEPGPANGRGTPGLARQAPHGLPRGGPGRAQAGLRQYGKRGASARAEADRLLTRLRAQGSEANADDLGDASMLPGELPFGPVSEVSRAFGNDFAATIEGITPGQWSGPVDSPYGLHLVLVVERSAAAQPALADVRPIVERELLADRRSAQLRALYERLLQSATRSRSTCPRRLKRSRPLA